MYKICVLVVSILLLSANANATPTDIFIAITKPKPNICAADTKKLILVADRMCWTNLDCGIGWECVQDGERSYCRPN